MKCTSPKHDDNCPCHWKWVNDKLCEHENLSKGYCVSCGKDVICGKEKEPEKCPQCKAMWDFDSDKCSENPEHSGEEPKKELKRVDIYQDDKLWGSVEKSENDQGFGNCPECLHKKHIDVPMQLKRTSDIVPTCPECNFKPQIMQWADEFYNLMGDYEAGIKEFKDVLNFISQQILLAERRVLQKVKDGLPKIEKPYYPETNTYIIDRAEGFNDCLDQVLDLLSRLNKLTK